MQSCVTPMIHVPDVRDTAAWYESVGFAVRSWHGCDADGLGTGPLPADMELDWVLLRWGADGVMLNAGGTRSDAARREVDLYIDLPPGDPSGGVDALFGRLQGKVDVVEPPYDAFHGNRELIIRDINGFWLTFAEPLDRQSVLPSTRSASDRQSTRRNSQTSQGSRNGVKRSLVRRSPTASATRWLAALSGWMIETMRSSGKCWKDQSIAARAASAA